MLKVLIADDHDIVIRGLKELLQSEFSEIDISEALTADAINAKIETGPWDLILLDILIPDMNVIDTLEFIRSRDTEVRVLILTAIPETEYAVRTIAAGANGYISKQYASNDLIKAVKTVLQGGTYLSQEAAEALAAGVRNTISLPHETLSTRELEVFCLIARGKAVKEIAFDMSLSAKTIATYIARIRQKTGLENYVDIARYALQHKLVD